MESGPRVKVRAAKEEDIAVIAQVAILAIAGHLRVTPLDILLPDLSEEERLEVMEKALTIEQPSKEGKIPAFVWKNFLVAEVDGKPAGALLPFWEGQKEGATDLAGCWVGQVITAMTELYGEERMENDKLAEKVVVGMKSVFAPILALKPDQCEFHTEVIATLPGFRGRGVCYALLQRAFEIGREKGFKEAELSVLNENFPAISAYTRAGYELILTVKVPYKTLRIATTGSSVMRAQL
eukprot:CAMPEP_0174259186 /NCGR_PEP_ID=MMETSP0439-20130205/8052_1 /TAXON_ID=0 /ORGANISM="Stereomyxa ramosa, Strain Chinc5" /LENGTH=237 /DNA_ID=CAMNT_0015342981 /DNA_START=21 /DNA_END=734 /DNA_ORIENTATION=+